MRKGEGHERMTPQPCNGWEQSMGGGPEWSKCGTIIVRNLLDNQLYDKSIMFIRISICELQV